MKPKANRLRTRGTSRFFVAWKISIQDASPESHLMKPDDASPQQSNDAYENARQASRKKRQEQPAAPPALIAGLDAHAVEGSIDEEERNEEERSGQNMREVAAGLGCELYR